MILLIPQKRFLRRVLFWVLGAGFVLGGKGGLAVGIDDVLE